MLALSYLLVMTGRLFVVYQHVYWILDRGILKSYPGNYDLYIEQKAHDIQVESQQNALFDKKLAEEEVWIRQGV